MHYSKKPLIIVKVKLNFAKPLVIKNSSNWIMQKCEIWPLCLRYGCCWIRRDNFISGLDIDE